MGKFNQVLCTIVLTISVACSLRTSIVAPLTAPINEDDLLVKPLEPPVEDVEEPLKGRYLEPPFEHGWDVFTGELAENIAREAPRNEAIDEPVERRLEKNDIVPNYKDLPVGSTVTFGGYSGTSLCAKTNRTAPVNGHEKCPLTTPWQVLWPTPKVPVGTEDCYTDDIRVYQTGDKLNSAPGLEVRMGGCPGSETNIWKGGYDWRYGGIRPQSNPDESLYTEVKEYIEKLNVNGTKRVVINAISGGTTSSYAFIMSQPLEWRKKNIAAWTPQVPVFGGTIASMGAFFKGWPRGNLLQCMSRISAIFTPSVYWFWPRGGEGKYHWNKTETIVFTPTKNYTAFELYEMTSKMCPKCGEMLKLEQEDLLNKFEAPGIDTYAFYGYGIPTVSGYKTKVDLNFSAFAEDICTPTQAMDAVLNPEWFGDGVGTLRSTGRAGAWVEEQKAKGAVLMNFGYKGMRHEACTSFPACAVDYKCVMNKIRDQPHSGC
eukprot:m.7705 g.7705  ORF g.7705 m.7705 type:complete len:486 (+) comp3759_c0_seq1:85-1542(+)